MHLKKLLRDSQRCKPDRKDYWIEPKLRVIVDNRYFAFTIIPIIYFLPRPYIHDGQCCVGIRWLNIHICFGIWRLK